MPDLVTVPVDVDTSHPTTADQPLIMEIIAIMMMMMTMSRMTMLRMTMLRMDLRPARKVEPKSD